MSVPAPLTDADPTEVGEYALVGRLGQGGQGVVYLGRGPDGAQAAVKMLHADALDVAGLRAQLAEEVEMARRVARFCTAQVLSADIEADPAGRFDLKDAKGMLQLLAAARDVARPLLQGKLHRWLKQRGRADNALPAGAHSPSRDEGLCLLPALDKPAIDEEAVRAHLLHGPLEDSMLGVGHQWSV